jgi:dephospho-CoA kinase
MLRIGLTGGIGSGKTTAAQFFAELNVPIIDADVIAHQLTQPEQSGFHAIIKHFGSTFISSSGTLDRARLRQLVFTDAVKKKHLEDILHPLIYAEIVTQLAQFAAPYCIIAIPLLIETDKASMVDRVLVVDCPVELQIDRVKQRSQMTETQIKAIIKTQVAREQRLAAADDVLDNSQSATQLAEQIKKLHPFYLSLSST